MSGDSSTLRFADYELDFARSELRRAGALVALQPTPLRVLLYLAEHRDRTVPRRELLDAIWPGVVVGDEALTTALAHARQAVGDGGNAQRVIRTLKGQGYRFVAEATVVNGDATGAPARSRRRVGIAAAAAALGASAIAVLVASRAPAPPPPVKRAPFGIAVLPVANLTRDAQAQALADGLTAQIGHALSRDGLPVVASTTAAQWKERGADVRALGRKLGVSHVLEGSVQREGERVRATVQLISTRTGKHVWSEAFQEPARDAFALQDRVTTRVAVQVYRYVWEDIVALENDPALAEVAALSLDVRRLWLEDRYEDLFVAADRLLAVAPKRGAFLDLRGQAHAWAAAAWMNTYAFGARPFEEAGPRLMVHAHAAVEASPNSPLAHSALWRAHFEHHAWSEAEREARRVCELAPRSGLCGFALTVCGALGCLDEQLDGARMAVAETPYEWASWFILSGALRQIGQLGEAETAAVRVRELEEAFGVHVPAIQWRLDKREEAVASLARLREAQGAHDAVREIERLRAQGPEVVWRRRAAETERAESLPGAQNRAAFDTAVAHAELGDWEATLRALERSVAKRGTGFEFDAVDPIFDPIRDTPRFRALIEKMGLTAYHEKYGVFERARTRVAAHEHGGH